MENQTLYLSTESVTEAKRQAERLRNRGFEAAVRLEGAWLDKRNALHLCDGTTLGVSFVGRFVVARLGGEWETMRPSKYGTVPGKLSVYGWKHASKKNNAAASGYQREDDRAAGGNPHLHRIGQR